MSYLDTIEVDMATDTIEQRLAKRIERRRGNVFLRRDFADLGGYDQVGRALRDLVRQGKLLRIGQGLYARAKLSSLSGKVIPAAGFAEITREALRRLGIRPQPTRLERLYRAGRSTQVLTGRVVGVARRVRRKIGYDGIYASFERGRPGAD